MNRQIIWQPQEGPQTALIQCPVFEVFFGGARGGGKTEASIGDWIQHSEEWGIAASGVFFRREQQQLDEVIARTNQIFPLFGAKFNTQKSTWVMQNGARLKFRYLARDQDAEIYQGHSYTRLYIEEATNFPSFAPIKKLFATLRSAKGVPCGIRLTGNPGGPGHTWVKYRYIDPDPKGFKVLTDTIEVEGFPTMVKERVFIPSKLRDNRLLMENDPLYVANLAQSGSKALVRAWLLGDWNSPVGAYFPQFSEARHVLPARFAQLIPSTALRFGSLDWGYSRPFSFGLWAISDGSWGLPRGALLRYKEWYGCTGKPNEGLQLDSPVVAAGIWNRLRNEPPLKYVTADPSMFKHDGSGPSHAENFAVHQVYLRRADNARLKGWDQVRAHLNGTVGLGARDISDESTLHPPLLYFLDSCPDAIRTIQSVPADPDKPDDIDTDSEDHAPDDIRYACTSRPWIIDHLPPLTITAKPTLDEIWEQREARRTRTPERIR